MTRSTRRVWRSETAVMVVVALSIASLWTGPIAGAVVPDGCRVWGVGSWSSANCDASVGGEYRAEAYCVRITPNANDIEVGAWEAAGSGRDSTAQCLGGYTMEQPLLKLRP